MKKSFKFKHGYAIYGFTLVELIVVITILAILWTVGFISISGYSVSARDGSRISDLANITKTLELTRVKIGYFPDPSSATWVTFSGWTVWTQWTIGDSVLRILSSVHFGLSKIPTDPLFTNIEYTYSLTSNKKEYQIGSIIEDSSIAFNSNINPFIASAYAADTLTAYVKGNYNGLMSQVKTASNQTCILSVPSILLHDTSIGSGTILNSWDSTQLNNLVLHKKGNLPSSYTQKHVTTTSSTFSFIPLAKWDDMTVGWSGIVVYCSGSLPSNETEVTTLFNNLKSIYSSAGLGADTISAPSVTSLFSPTNNNSAKLVNIAAVLSASLGGSLVHIQVSSDNVDSYIQANLDTLNTFWSNGDLDVYNSEGNVLICPLTKQQWYNISKLDWHGGVTIPGEIFTLTQLPILYLENNSLISIPPEIVNLKNLTHLHLNNNPLLWDLSNDFDINSPNKSQSWIPIAWKTMTIWGNGTNITISIVTDPVVEVCNYQQTDIDALNISWANGNLDLYDGNGNNVTTFPLTKDEWCSVTEFYWLGGSTILPEIFTLNLLTILGLESNQLTSIPVGIWNLSNLTDLDLANNQLTSFPTEILNLSNLTYLNLANNQLASIPVGIWNLSNLTHLTVGGNQFTIFPTGILNLSNLTELGLESEQLTSIPPEIWNLSNLTYISLYGNQLTSLPLEIWNLSNLTTFNLANNQLATLPTEIWNLSNLRYLALSENVWLWALNNVFDAYNTPTKSQSWIPSAWQTMTIWWNGTNVVITITP